MGYLTPTCNNAVTIPHSGNGRVRKLKNVKKMYLTLYDLRMKSFHFTVFMV